ncbi:RsmB/NOP family class I SAM-dependent RNA methyltransferase [Halomarina oriensis]|uniref:NOL1/NOP2/sun family putative RNA methylase n=1 Tax=Halomarina oriensis TaxID=671145 RepID=A0A6B0GPX0_9EURY|nr:RsmB/NOP family class I SAM-dependent RNA methyltransferase [Halomarina oriensis]MWG35619.1 NOL1/NOP2/sun family putative RNA methylase [Halomarina oriensis]
MVLERYDPLVDDVDAFRAACERPLPSVVRVNTVKTTVDRAMAALDADGHGYDRLDWLPELLRLDSDSPGTSWPYFHGWLYGQEEVSALPALVCDPQPGERVLDPCAAPGSKTTQLAAMMDDTGTLVANDNNLGRLSALRSNAERCGVTNLVVTNQDARNLSLKPFTADESDEQPPFDRALVDVPCSCEGTVRKNPDALDDWSVGHLEQIAGVQRDILRRAVQTTREGGTVVYSTCTFAPEENEAVLDHVLREEPVELVEFDVPLETRPGVTEWNGEAYAPSVERAKRVWPHLNDTGGFFCAKLEVTA